MKKNRAIRYAMTIAAARAPREKIIISSTLAAILAAFIPQVSFALGRFARVKF